MTAEERIALFQNELAWIQDDAIRSFVHDALIKLPDYFFHVAASSTGKYHPAYALGEGGLVRHTKAAVIICKDLLCLEMYGKFTPIQRDIMLGALILHDGLKHGVDGGAYTQAKHPVIIANWLENTENGMGIYQRLPKEVADPFLSCLRSHMGQWNTDYRTHAEILPKPATQMEKFVHQCDYLASRKYLELNFDAVSYSGDRV